MTFAHVDVLVNPDIRDGIKHYGDWPTIPQLYIGGELVGGSDIIVQMAATGELQQALGLPPVSGLFLRGTSPGQVLVLVDGVKIGSPTSGVARLSAKANTRGDFIAMGGSFGCDSGSRSPADYNSTTPTRGHLPEVTGPQVMPEAVSRPKPVVLLILDGWGYRVVLTRITFEGEALDAESMPFNHKLLLGDRGHRVQQSHGDTGDDVPHEEGHVGIARGLIEAEAEAPPYRIACAETQRPHDDRDGPV